MPMSEEQRKAVNELMKEADICGVTVAEFDQESIQTEVFGNTDKTGETPVTAETVFAAASLSKPVFAYLVYKIAKDPQYKSFTLDTPLHTILEDQQIIGNEARKKLTARIILSHQSGWPNKSAEHDQAPAFLFQPGEGYAYSGVAYGYLQKVVEEVTGLPLEEFAEPIFKKLGMKSSSFLPVDGKEVLGANSLFTTASDYALFCKAAMKEKELFEIASLLSPKRDKWAASQGLSNSVLQKVAWGLGWGLQKTEQGKVTRAFHCGDMDQWRGFVALDLERQTGVVYFANSPNGLILTDTIISPAVELNDGLKFVFRKHGFARKIEPNWQENERLRIDKIIEKNMPDLWIEIQKSRAEESK